jgi:hypothetical protein
VIFPGGGQHRDIEVIINLQQSYRNTLAVPNHQVESSFVVPLERVNQVSINVGIQQFPNAPCCHIEH